MNESALVNRVWNYAHVLRRQGIPFGDYIEQITYLLFHKMDEEREDLLGDGSAIPDIYRWHCLKALDGDDLESRYRHALEGLSREKGLMGQVFKGAQNKITDPVKLKRLISLIDGQSWLALDTDVKGTIYEGLLERNAQEVKSGAGQYFTPRPLIQTMVEVIDPRIPAAPTAARRPIVSTRPASDIEVTLFRQILMVPFAIEAADRAGMLASGRKRVSAIAAGLGEPWREITAERWRHLPTDVIAEGEALAAAYAELVYFEPAVQRYLFGWAGEQAKEAPIRLWQRRDVRALDIAIGAGDECRRWQLRVDRLNLYLFDTGNAMLVVELAFDPALVPGTGDPRDRLPCLAAVMRLIECSRRTFPPYFFIPAGERRLVPGFFPSELAWVAEPALPPVVAPRTPADFIEHARRRRTPALHQAWRALLADLPLDSDREPPSEGFLLSQLGDDRAFSIVVMGVGDIGAIAEPDWVRLAMCDGPGNGWPYGREFLREWQSSQAYDRHFHGEQGGTRYLFSGYSFATIGTARRPDDDERCDFRDTFAEHGRRHYFQLCLIAYFQKAALLTLSERLADAALATDSTAATAHAIERDILQFTNRYWFETLSAQVQAQEIFDRLRDNLRLRPLYEQVRREVREADAFWTSEEQQAIARVQTDMARRQTGLAHSADQLNRIAGPVLAASLVAGLFGANVLFDWDLVDRWPLTTLGLTLALVFLILGWATRRNDRGFFGDIEAAWGVVRAHKAAAVALFVIVLAVFHLVDGFIGLDPPGDAP